MVVCRVPCIVHATIARASGHRAEVGGGGDVGEEELVVTGEWCLGAENGDDGEDCGDGRCVMLG